MSGKLRHFLQFLLAGALLYGIVVQAQQPFAYDLKVGSSDDTTLTFGRLADAEATDAVDKLDSPAPPSGCPSRPEVGDLAIPVEGVTNYMYFRGSLGYFNPDISKAVGDAYCRLSKDNKSATPPASTWVLEIADTVQDTVDLSWTAIEVAAGVGPGAPPGGTFRLVTPDGEVKVADLRTSANASLAKGTYYIQYYAQDAEPAPPTPLPIYDTIARASGQSKDVVLDFDPAEFTAGNLQTYYYMGDDQVFPIGTRAVGAAINGNVLTYTLPNDISEFDTVVINYTLTRNGAGADAPSATGTVELRFDDIIEIVLTEVAVGGVAADISGDPITVKVDYTDDETAYKPITMKYEITSIADKLTLEANRYAFIGPDWKGAQADYPWTITFTVTNPGEAEEDVAYQINFADNNGVITPTCTADILSKLDQVLTITLQPALAAKSGTVDFAIIPLEEGQETANVFTAPDVTLQLKQDANLDLDGDGILDYPDVRLFFNYVGNGSIDDEAMVAGTVYGLDRAAELRQKIAGMVKSLDIDGDGNFDYVDVRLIFNYAGDGSIDNDAMVTGTIHPANRAEEFRAKIADMIEQ